MRCIAGLFVLLSATAAVAQDTKFVKDGAHSEINFVAEARLLDAHGFWDKWDADIMFNPTAWEKSSVKLVIETKSVNTRNERRDNHLRSKDFFFADSFPQITFTSKIVNKLSDTRLNVTGDLTIRGITKPVTIPATLVFWDDKAQMGRFKGSFTIVRTDFGVGYSPPGNPIADDVVVSFNLTFRAAPAAR
ncbi:MAG TPA: YceI family protein [Gemmatimonadaceae bacterium]